MGIFDWLKKKSENGRARSEVLASLSTVMGSVRDEYGRRPFVMAMSYIAAVEYLDNCGEFTLTKLRQAYAVAGINGPGTDTETATLWERSQLVLSSAAAGRGTGEPGGPEFIRFDLRRTLMEGIMNAAPHCRAASGDVKEWLAAKRQRL